MRRVSELIVDPQGLNHITYINDYRLYYIVSYLLTYLLTYIEASDVVNTIALPESCDLKKREHIFFLILLET